MFEKYYTPEQLQQLEQRRNGSARTIKVVEQEWREIYAKLADLRGRGVDPAAPEAQAVGDRAGELIQMFTGGDPGIRVAAADVRAGGSAEADPRHGRPRGHGLHGRDQNGQAGLVRDPEAGQPACSVTASSRTARRHCGGASSHE